MNIILKTLIGVLFLSAVCQAYSRSTPANSDGGGDLIFLDRHNVYCNDGEALQGFQIVTPAGGQMAVNYNCFSSDAVLKNGAYTPSYTAYTDWTPSADIGREDIGAYYIKNIPIQCNPDYGLQGFKLETNCSSMICNARFKYTCAYLKVKSCGSAETAWVDCGDGQLYTFNRVPFYVGNYQVITGFKLYVNFYSRWFNTDGRNFKFSYNYCNLRNMEAEIAAYSKDTSTVPSRP